MRLKYEIRALRMTITISRVFNTCSASLKV